MKDINLKKKKEIIFLDRPLRQPLSYTTGSLNFWSVWEYWILFIFYNKRGKQAISYEYENCLEDLSPNNKEIWRFSRQFTESFHTNLKIKNNNKNLIIIMSETHIPILKTSTVYKCRIFLVLRSFRLFFFHINWDWPLRIFVIFNYFSLAGPYCKKISLAFSAQHSQYVVSTFKVYVWSNYCAISIGSLWQYIIQIRVAFGIIDDYIQSDICSEFSDENSQL